MIALHAAVVLLFASILAICITSLVADIRCGWPVIRIALGLDEQS